MVIDPASWPTFFVKAAVGPAGWPRFFDGAVICLAINKAVGLAIGGAILTGADVAVGFSGLSL